MGPDSTRYTTSNGLTKTVEVTLPRGMIGNPEALPKCDPVKFAERGATGDSTACPADTQVGYINVRIGLGPYDYGRSDGALAFDNPVFRYVPIYNLDPPKGTPADFSFNIQEVIQAHIYATLDPAQSYAIKAVSPNISEYYRVREFEVTLWGVPGDSAHDKFRYYPEATGGKLVGAPFTAPIRPFYTNPADCGFDNGGHRIRIDSYQHPEEFSPVQEYPDPLNVTGCNDPRFRFEPKVAMAPTDRHSGAPTGLDVHLEVPQRNDEVKEAKELYAKNGFVKGISTPPIKRTVITLPQGMTINPSAAQGLGSCTLEQIGISSAGVPNDNPAKCPDDSQYGTLTLHTPILPENVPMKGFVYIARQNENPFNDFLALYLVIEEPERGLLVKIPGKIDLDPVTGQITTTFDNLPQFPVSDFQITLKGGVRAALVNPSTCGEKTIRAEFFTWQDPSTPHVVTNSYPVTEKPDGSACVNNLGERPFGPSLSAGTLSNAAGSFSPFDLRLTRTDDDQEFSQLGLTMPPGVSAKIAGVAQCPDAGIAQAQAAGRTGAEEIASPSCPASSLIGSIEVGTGVGVPLTYVPGSVYFAGPYKGAPFSLVVITPAVVGPYDLGVVAVRSALYVDPLTAQVTVVTDPFPQIFKGIPVRIRDIRVNVDRPGFTFNSTSCAPLTIGAHITGTGADVNSTADDSSASLSARFQAAGCASLGFKPSFKASTSGKPSRKNGASLDVKLSYPKEAMGKDANIRSVKVNLPKQLPSRLTTLQKACVDSVFAANPASCPAASRVGSATAVTPILPVPLSGPAYFVSHGGAKFPELIVVLQGDNVTVQLHGETFISNAGITSSTFRQVPDVPVSTFELRLPQGPNSALAANGNLCKSKLAMPTVFTAQNGLQIKQSTKIGVTNCPKAKKKVRHARRKGHGLKK